MMPDIGSQWDAIIQAASQRNLESTPMSAARLGTSPVQLLPTPKVRYLPTIPRDISRIAKSIRDDLRRLVSGQAPWPYLLTGNAGTGKTCAALCLLDYAGGWYRELPDLCRELNDIDFGRKYTDGAENEGGNRKVFPADFWKAYSRQPMVVIDEIGCREKVSDAHYDAMKRAIDARAGKPLMVLSNHNIEAIGKLYDDRIASRLGAGTVLHLTGADRRIKGAA